MGGRGSCGSLSRRRQRWKLTHQLWVESQTRIKDAQTVRFRSQSCHLFRLSLQRLLTRSRSCYFSFAAGGKKEAAPHWLGDSMISASLQGGKGSCGSLSRRRQRWKLTHQLWVESQTRIKDAQTVRFRSQSCHLFRLSLQRLLTRSRSCYFSFAAGGKRKRLLTGSATA